MKDCREIPCLEIVVATRNVGKFKEI
ncbi:MAG: hypothetical protein H6Q43_1307, partial [Deltaproteobacteria bacterium]|nr:hypothetical protein [Deltaproteobacteria bacterium]